MFNQENLAITTNSNGASGGILIYFTPDDTIENILNDPSYFKSIYSTPLYLSVFSRGCDVIIKDARNDTYKVTVDRAGDLFKVKSSKIVIMQPVFYGIGASRNYLDIMPRGIVLAVDAHTEGASSTGNTNLTLMNGSKTLATGIYGDNSTPPGYANITLTKDLSARYFDGSTCLNISNTVGIAGQADLKFNILMMCPVQGLTL